MDELSLFSEQEKTMTTRELSEVLGVDKTTITKTVKRLEEGGAALHHLTNDKYGNCVWIFTEKQATIIKQEIQKHHNLSTRQIDGVTTDYEMELMTQKVLAYHVQKAAEYKARMEVAEKALDRIESAPGCFTMSQTAKALKLPYGRTMLFRTLRNMRLLNDRNEPYQDQVNADHFKVVSKVCADGKNHLVPLVTGKGLVFLAKRFNTEIDKSVKADA